jgi:LPXTG-motif cell wall-anchored protein
MRRWVFAFVMLLTAATALLPSPAAWAQAGTLTFDPSNVVAAGGGKLNINGSCEANTSGFVISQAFAGQPSVSEFAGVPAVAIETSSTGTFGIGLTIAPTVSPGDYSVSLRCGGGLAASGTLTVQALPRTGAPVEKFALVGAVLLTAGAALAGFSRRRLARPTRSAGV